MSILSCFPYETFRKNQKEALQFIEEALNNQYEYSIIEGPCGFGKTPVSFAAALHFSKTFLLTTQKVLQDQYVEEHGGVDLKVIKGRNNYICKQNNHSCDKGDCVLNKCPEPSACAYNVAKNVAKNADIALMNYVYFLYIKRYTEDFSHRNTMVCDEAHSIESVIMNFVNVRIKSDYLKRFGLPTYIPDCDNADGYINWMYSLLEEIPGIIASNEGYIKVLQGESTNKTKMVREKEIEELLWKNDRLSSIKEKIDRFIETSDDVKWIPNLQRDIKGETDDSMVLDFKPINVSYFAEDILFKHADKKILFSATILNKNIFCKSLGIDPNKAHYVRVPSPFSRENRRMHYVKSGSMEYKCENETLVQYVKDVEKILDLFSNFKGMIYTNTYKINSYLIKHIGDKYKSRLITHTRKNREDVLQRFKISNDPLVLVTASLGEGVDLKGDLARFEIITKIPYANVSDPQIKARMIDDRTWYQNDACIRLEQIAGRCVRHENDYCSIFLMDSRFGHFVHDNMNVLHNYFILSTIPEQIKFDRVKINKSGRLIRIDKGEEYYE